MRIKSNSGFSLVEAMVAIGILGVVLVAITDLISFSMNSLRRTDQMAETTNLLALLSNTIASPRRCTGIFMVDATNPMLYPDLAAIIPDRTVGRIQLPGNISIVVNEKIQGAEGITVTGISLKEIDILKRSTDTSAGGTVRNYWTVLTVKTVKDAVLGGAPQFSPDLVLPLMLSVNGTLGDERILGCNRERGSLWSEDAAGNLYRLSGKTSIGLSPAYSLIPGAQQQVDGAGTFNVGKFFSVTANNNGNGAADGNLAAGVNALSSTTPGTNATAFGTSALELNTGSNNSAIGYRAMASNTTGSDNTAFGSRALTANTTGLRNSAMGMSALMANTSGNDNTAFGHSALIASTGASANTAIGYQAMSKITLVGSGNTAFGNYSLGAGAASTTGASNTAIGHQSLNRITGGSENTAVGYQAIYGMFPPQPPAPHPVALVPYGSYWPGGNTAGIGNTYVGANAGGSVIGSRHIAIGVNAIAAASNSIQIGQGRNALGVAVAGEGSLKIGDSYNILIPQLGATGVGLFFDAATGFVGTPASDRRLKKNIEPITMAMAKILRLQGVTYLPKNAPQTKTRIYGLIAQDVEPVVPAVVNTAPDKRKTKTINYAALVGLLVEGVKEQQKTIEGNRRVSDQIRKLVESR